jgi:pSer/pThr/pTyr-binding forkhead associated (FHA) protein
MDMAVSLELIHPNGFISLQSWTFENESAIRIGRESDNHVVLDGEVVSGCHAMLWGVDNEWKIVNLSCNGTYLDNIPVTHALLKNGSVIRLSPSGPRIRFRIVTNPGASSLREDLDEDFLLSNGFESDSFNPRQTPASVRGNRNVHSCLRGSLK